MSFPSMNNAAISPLDRSASRRETTWSHLRVRRPSLIWPKPRLHQVADFQFIASERTPPSQPFGGRTFRMKAMVRARSTTSESPYLPGLIQFGPYIASGTFVSYDHGDPWVEAYVLGLANRYQFGL